MDHSRWIYLDHNATTPCDGRVVEMMLPYFSGLYANPGSPHLFGLELDEAVEVAKSRVAGLLSAKANEIVFTSGATESLNMAIKGFFAQPKRHIVTIATEHKAVLDVCRYMETRGFSVSYLGVAQDGLLDLALLKNSLTKDTALVAVALANNETGVLQPISDIAKIVHANASLLLCDATQAVGKIPVKVSSLGVDLMAFSGHKFYGPKGIGGLYISDEIQPKPQTLLHGGGQQRDRRSGTLNVPGIVGLAEACEIAQAEMTSDQARISLLRDRLESGLLKIASSFVNGNREKRLYNTTNICFPGLDSAQLILALQNIAVSNGAACSALLTEPSHVLKAMHLGHADALASVRFSLGRSTTVEEIETVIARVTALVSRFRL